MGEERTESSTGRTWQLRRFCLYGFLKNLQFFEPFLILAFRDKGFSFAAIGLLIGFRAICVNLMEIPSGAIADAWGRRRAMILSMLGYILSFLVFAFAEAYWVFYVAMLCFAIGEAFRTGTHKAMIFDWLVRHGGQDQKTRIYGLTRSWSKQGSALNCVVAAAVLIGFGDYRWIFLLAVVPYIGNVVNLTLYPRYLDGRPDKVRSAREGWRMLVAGFKLALGKRALRRLIFENVCYEGMFSIVKDYLQPILRISALSLPVLLAASGQTRTAVLVAAVYLVLNLASSVASRLSHRAVAKAGSEKRLGFCLWMVSGACYVLMLVGFVTRVAALPIIGFVTLFVLLNIWKPALVSRFHDEAELDTAATTLSIANQSKTLAIALVAPLLGVVIDRSVASTVAVADLYAFWPVAALGLVAGVVGIGLNRMGKETS